MTVSMPSVTAIVCTRNRAERLEACIRSLLCQSLGRDHYEILVVDNASTDHTPRLCATYESEPGFRWIREPAVGLSHARNTGWRQAKGKYLGYIDDDAEADRGWIEAALRCFETVTPPPAWVGGPIDLAWDAARPSWLTAALHGPLGEVDWGENPLFLTADCHLGGGNSFFPRSVLEKAGGFDTRLGRQGACLLSGEETELAWRLTDQGGLLYYHPRVRIRHHVEPDRLKTGWFYRRYYWGGYTDALMMRTLRGSGHDRRIGAAQAGGKAIRRGDQVRRLLGNLARAAGFCASAQGRVLGRVYMAYVAGRVAGSIAAQRRTAAPQDAEGPHRE
jgi:glucosyl-dolichyl phosphate glucuronosyltransferase